MKLKQWQVLPTDTMDTCKHTQFTCNDCGSVMFQKKTFTKNKQNQMVRLLKRIRKAEVESGLITDIDSLLKV